MPVIELEQDKNINLNVDKEVKDELSRKKCYIAELIKDALNKYLDFDDLSVDSTYSVYKLPIVNEETTIIDFEINSLSVHVIPTIGKSKNANVYIPKEYRTYSCKPDMIIFVNFTKNLAKMNILGYVTDINLNTLAISKSALKSEESLIQALKTIKPKGQRAEENAISATQELMLAYIDSSLSEEGHQFFVRHLLSSKEVRKNYKLFYAMSCKFISVASKHQHLTDDDFVAINSIPDDDDLLKNNEKLLIESPVIENASDDSVEQAINEEEDFSDDTLLQTEDEFSEVIEEPTITNEELPLVEDEFDLTDNIQEPIENFETEVELHSDDLLEENNNDADAFTELNYTDIANDDEFELMDAGEEILLEESGDSLLSEVSNEPEEQVVKLLDEQAQPSVEEVQLDSDNESEPVVELLETPSAGISIDNDEQLNAELLQSNKAVNTDDISEIQVTEGENGADGDDLFSFLSEMAEDENLSANEDIQPAAVQQEEVPQVELTEQKNVEQKNVEPSEPESTISEDAPAVLNEAFNPNVNEQEAATPSYNDYSQVDENNASKKNSFMPIAAAALAVLLVGCGVGGYFFKDKLPFIGSSPELQDLTEDKDVASDLPKPVIPAPPSQTGAETSNSGPVAPPPAANAPAANAPADTKNNVPQPQGQNASNKPEAAQKLPNLPATVEPPKPKHLNDAIATALTKDFSGVRISKLSWEVSETLVNNPDVNRYLKIAGKSVKNSLSQDLMAATEASFNDTVVVNITYKKDGSLGPIKIANSSGSQQIDNIIVKSVKDTLNYIKMPALNLNKPEYTAKLIVRL